MGSVELLRMLGVKIGYIPEMTNAGCFVTSQNVVLFRLELTDAEREDAAAQMMTDVLAHESALQAQ